jgi:DNA invertase Pin-like site-specific DNA recombinase
LLAESVYGLQDLEDDIQDYGVYADDINIVFDQEELTDSEDEVNDFANESIGGKDLKERERQDIYEALLELSNRGKLKKNSTHIIAQRFNVKLRTVQRVWQRAKEYRADGTSVDVRSKKPINCGRKRIVVDLSSIASIPLHRRTTIRSLAKELGVKRTTLHRLFKNGEIRRHSSSLKPYLKEENKIARLKWCLRMLDLIL